MDVTKLGTVTARAMDRIEKHVESGNITEDSYIGAVIVVVAIDEKTPDDAPDRDNLRDIATRVFVWAEPQEIYIQDGLLQRALDNYSRTGTDDDS